MKIPKSFQLGPHHVTVHYKKNLWAKDEKAGEADLGNQKITLQPAISGQYNRKCAEQAFFHELGHMLLFYAGQRELYVDEVLVDILGSLLMQFFNTKKGIVK